MTDFPHKSNAGREKNFIKENILRIKHSYPSEIKQRFVDTRYGDTHDIRNCGLFPVYIYKKNYGNVFKSSRSELKIEGVRTKMEQKTDFNGDKVSRMSSCRYIDQEERKILLDGMKQKWDETMKLFQRLPFLVDTLPKAQKKAKMERELQQLEKDITIIEQHPRIYVCNNVDNNDTRY